MTAKFGGVDVVPLQGAIVGVDVVPLLGAIPFGEWMWCHGCHSRVPISMSYLPSIFRATNFTHTTKKTTMDFVLSFLQTLRCSLH